MKQENWDELRFFLAVVRLGTVRAAADHLKVSPATVARRVRQLETYAGAMLFDRRGHETSLTEIGHDLFQTAVLLEDEFDGLKRRLFGRQKELEGPVVLTMIEGLATPPVMSIFKEFCDLYPRIDLQITVTNSLANLNRRDADLAIRTGSKPEETLIGRRVGHGARAVYVSRQLYDARTMREGHDQSPGSEFGWISYTSASEDKMWKSKTPFPDVVTRIRIPDLRSQILACEQEMGMIFAPCMLCDGRPDFYRLSIPEFPDQLTIWLLRHRDSRMNAAVTALSDFFAEKLKSLEPLFSGQISEMRELL